MMLWIPLPKEVATKLSLLKQGSEWKIWHQNLAFIGFGLHVHFDCCQSYCHFCQFNQWESRILNQCSISQQSRQNLLVRSKEMNNFQLHWSIAYARQERKLVENLKSVNYNVTLSTYAEMR